MLQKKAVRMIFLMMGVLCLLASAGILFGGLSVRAAENTLTLTRIASGTTTLPYLHTKRDDVTLHFFLATSKSYTKEQQTEAVLSCDMLTDGKFLTFTSESGGYAVKITGTAAPVSPAASFTLSVGGDRYDGTISTTAYIAQNGDASMQYTLYSTSNKPIDRMTINNRVNLTITIEDPTVSLLSYQSVRSSMQVSLNSNVFYGANATADAGKAMDGGGVRYNLTFSNIRYEGTSSDLFLSVRYGSGLPWRRITAWMPEAVVDESAISSSTPPMPDPDDYDGNSSTSSYVFTPPPTPNIIVSEYDYGGGMVMAATDVNLLLTFQNTSDRITIGNIVMKITMPEAFAIKNSSNTFYFAKLPPRDKLQQELLFSVKPSAEPISHPIKIGFTYETVINKERKSHTADVEIAVPVSQLNRVTLQPVTVSESFIMGQEENAFDAKFVNMGKSQIYNTTLTMVGENLKNSGFSVFLGNIDSGKEATGSFTIEAAAAGDISGEVVLSYEDASMNITELRTPFFTVANEPPQMEPPMDYPTEMPTDMPMEAPKWYQKYPPYYYVVGGVVLLIVLAYAVKLWKSVREKKLAKMDEDF